MHKCPIRGCHKKLDSNGFPVEYCDFQQGRCPMQNKPIKEYSKVFLYTTLTIYTCLLILILRYAW